MSNKNLVFPIKQTTRRYLNQWWPMQCIQYCQLIWAYIKCFACQIYHHKLFQLLQNMDFIVNRPWIYDKGQQKCLCIERDNNHTKHECLSPNIFIDIPANHIIFRPWRSWYVYRFSVLFTIDRLVSVTPGCQPMLVFTIYWLLCVNERGWTYNMQCLEVV